MAVSQLPDPPARSDPSTFAAKGDAFLGALPQFGTELNAVQVDVNNKQVITTNASATAVSAKDSALASKAAAEAASNATVWVSGTTYAAGDVRYSPINFRTFRRKTNGVSTTDPSADAANWVSMGSGGTVLLATAEVTTAVSTIDFLNLFTTEFDTYSIEFIGLKAASGIALQMQFAIGGVVDSSSIYSRVNAINTETNSLANSIFVANITSSVSNGETSGSTTIQGTSVGARKSAQSNTVSYFFRNTDSTNVVTAYFQAGLYNNTAAATGFRLSTTGSTLTAGSFRIYGHTK